jgi:pimeloyl-ACP methyl ester carboxylesterase
MLRIVFVHGACVKDGSWWWHRTGELLAEQGIASEAPALPSCGETGEPTDAQGPGLSEDVAAVRDVLTASDEPTVVVAHSYGGIVTAEAAAGVEAVRHLLLVSSYLPEVGQSLSSFGAEEPAPFLEIDPEGGTFTVRPDALAETFLQDCDPEIQRAATDKTARHFVDPMGGHSSRTGTGDPLSARRESPSRPIRQRITPLCRIFVAR